MENKNTVGNNSTIEPDTERPVQENEHMDVHHHTHHYGKKNWKIYFWEFLLLFLAVFCGFLAENQREYMTERKREKQYIRTLLIDIKTDISNLQTCIAAYSSTQDRIDTILNHFDDFQDNFSAAAGRNLFHILYFHNDFIYTDPTMQQLKYAGGFRLIKTGASDSIIAYDAAVKNLFSQADYNSEVYIQLIDLSNKLISFYRVKKENPTKQVYEITQGNADCWITHEPRQFQQLYNQVNLYRATNRYSVNKMKVVQKRGIDLIHFLKKEYHLE